MVKVNGEILRLDVLFQRRKTMFQSRWGFHPCDYATFRKLKFLHHVYQKALRMAHAWERWKRKAPHNRVMRCRIRNDRGQTIGYETPVPLAEPRICPIFSQKILENRHVDNLGKVYRDGFLDERVVTEDLGIAGDFAGARRPAKELADVRQLRVSVEAIGALYEQARSWMEERTIKK
jgi:hypothetical protein